jgi:quercetin dioxygenase-like cupin family protein
MSTTLAMKDTQERNHHKPRLMPNGTLFEFLVSPDETGSEMCLIRGTIPPGVAVPLHSHSDVELFHVLEGSLEAFQFGNGNHGWESFGPGEIVSISGNTKHALRNSSTVPATVVVVIANWCSPLRLLCVTLSAEDVAQSGGDSHVGLARDSCLAEWHPTSLGPSQILVNQVSEGFSVAPWNKGAARVSCHYGEQNRDTNQ